MRPQDTEPRGWRGIKRSIAKLTKTVEALRTITIQRSGTSDSVSVGQSGITINLKEIKTPRPGASAAQGADSKHAFQLVDAATDTLCVRKGTVYGSVGGNGNITPTIGVAALTDNYLDNELTLPGANTTRTYYLVATESASGELDQDGIDEVSIEFSDTATFPTISSAQAAYQLGSVTTDGSGDIDYFSSNLSGSQTVDSCGSFHSWNSV